MTKSPVGLETLVENLCAKLHITYVYFAQKNEDFGVKFKVYYYVVCASWQTF